MNQKGQATTEVVLMLTVMVATAVFISTQFKSNSFFINLAAGPWESLAGLIQNGVLGSPDDTMVKHPNQFSRVGTPEGDVTQ